MHPLICIVYHEYEINILLMLRASPWMPCVSACLCVLPWRSRPRLHRLPEGRLPDALRSVLGDPLLRHDHSARARQPGEFITTCIYTVCALACMYIVHCTVTCMCTGMNVRWHACTVECMYSDMHTYSDIHVHCTVTCMCTGMHAQWHACTVTRMCACMHAWWHVWVEPCMPDWWRDKR